MSKYLPTVLYVGCDYTEHQPEEWTRFIAHFNVIIYDCPSVDEFIARMAPGGEYSTIDAIMRPSWLKAPPFQHQHLFRGKPVDYYPPSLKIIVSGGHGYDVVDVERLADRGIVFCNSPNTCTEATANCAMYLILNAFRYFTFAERCVRTEQFDTSRQLSRIAEDPSSHVLAVIGLGDIGLAIAQRAEAFGMQIHYFSPSRKPEAEATFRTPITYHTSLNSALQIADCICLACPYSRKTHHMLSEREFNLMKPGVRIVNIARGPLIDEEALIAAMEQGKVIGVGLDVHENEPHVHPRLKDNYMTTLLPHIGVCSKASWRNFESNCIKNLEAYFYGDRKPITPVLARNR